MSYNQYSKVQFHFLTSTSTLKERTRLKNFIKETFQKQRKKLDTLSYIFCSDEYLLTINRDFLQHDYYTDIITFDLSETDKTIGEIYISIDRVKDNAKTLGTTIKEELHRVIFHGVLHLCGFKDKNAKEEVEMRKQEQKLLDRYFKK